MLVNNVDHNISNYYGREYTRDLLAQNLQYKIALPGHRHLVKIVEDKVQILNYPLNRDDVRGAEDIWGGNLRCLRGPPGIWNSMVPPRSHCQRPVPLKGVR